MNWDAIGAVAEVIGVIGLIISIGYLGMQVHQGNRVAQVSALQGVFAIVLDHTRGLVEGDNRDIVIKGLIDYRNLKGADKLAFDSLMMGLMGMFEAALASSDVGLLDDEHPDGFACYLRTRMLPYNGMRDWWTDAKDIFGPDVQVWVATQISKTDVESDFFGTK